MEIQKRRVNMCPISHGQSPQIITSITINAFSQFNKIITQYYELNHNKIKMLLKVSLKYHSPQEIYDFLLKFVTSIGLKVKNKYAIVGFEDANEYDEFLQKHRISILYGHRLEFFPITKADQATIFDDSQKQKTHLKQFPHFLPQSPPQLTVTHPNKIQESIKKSYLQTIKKIQKSFMQILEHTKIKVEQLQLRYQQQESRQRQLFGLEKGIQMRVKQASQQFETNVKKLLQSIDKFGNNSQIINLDYNLKMSKRKEGFFNIGENNMGFGCERTFEVSGKCECQRLCALNEQDFAVSMFERISEKQKKGYVKIFSINQSFQKESFEIYDGIYGLERVNKLIMAGGSQGQIHFVNLQEQIKTLMQSSPKNLYESPNCSIVQIKVISEEENKNPRILVADVINLNVFEIVPQVLRQGLCIPEFEHRHTVKGISSPVRTMEFCNSNSLLFSQKNSIIRYHFEKSTAQPIYAYEKDIRKIRKFDSNIYAISSNREVSLFDLRIKLASCTKFIQLSSPISNLQVVGDHSIIYGSMTEIGLLDDRRLNFVPWSNCTQHKGEITDIMKVSERLVSCDKRGGINSWKLHEM